MDLDNISFDHTDAAAILFKAVQAFLHSKLSKDEEANVAQNPVIIVGKSKKQIQLLLASSNDKTQYANLMTINTAPERTDE